MLERMPRVAMFAAIVAALASVNIENASAANEPVDDLTFVKKDLTIVKNDTTVSVSDAGRRVLRYRYANVPMKPYVDQLFSPAGVQVLRDSPHDHKHHHGLMFATAADGVDFWGEEPQSGKQKKRSLTTRDGMRSQPHGKLHRCSGVAEYLDWTSPANKLLLVEYREVYALDEATVERPSFGASLIEWRSRLQAPPGSKTVVLSGAHYFGLGMRFPTSMDSGGRFFNADDKQGEIVRGDERVTPTRWCAYTAKADGKTVTVAIFDHPKNCRHPARMFTMNTPFAYLSATCNVWKEPITIKAGKPLDLRYGVAVWDGAVDKKTVEKLYQRWLKLSSDK
jgi:hypothetical protein